MANSATGILRASISNPMLMTNMTSGKYTNECN